MLSISTSKTPGTRIQSALSLASGSPVTNRSLLRKAIALASGYSSYEQAEALNSRSKMIMDRLWVERSPADNNNWTVRAVNVKVVIDSAKEKVMITNIDGEQVGLIAMPHVMSGFNFNESSIEFCPKFNKVIFSSLDTGHKIVIQRVSESELSISMHGVDAGHNSSVKFSQYDFNQVSRWMDHTQTARMLAECVMLCDDDSNVEFEANQMGFTGLEMKKATDTALWLFEKDKGYEGDIIDELEPKVKAPKSMGLFAHLYLENYYAGSQKRINELCESMSLEIEDLNDMRCRFKAEADWFLLTYVKS